MSFKDRFSKEAHDENEQRLLEHKRESTKQLKVVGWVAGALIAAAAVVGYGATKAIGEALDTD